METVLWVQLNSNTACVTMDCLFQRLKSLRLWSTLIQTRMANSLSMNFCVQFVETLTIAVVQSFTRHTISLIEMAVAKSLLLILSSFMMLATIQTPRVAAKLQRRCLQSSWVSGKPTKRTQLSLLRSLKTTTKTLVRPLTAMSTSRWWSATRKFRIKVYLTVLLYRWRLWWDARSRTKDVCSLF